MIRPSYISLFSGAGGLDLGLERAGFKAVSLCEIESVYCDTLKENQGDTHADGRRYFMEANIVNADIQDIAGVLWVLKGKDDADRQRKLQSWIKKSYQEANRFGKKFVNLYKNSKSPEVKQKVRERNKTITAHDKIIAKFTENGIKYLPDTQTICEQVFKTISTSIGMFALNHNAIHPDLLVLTDCVSDKETLIEFKGDTDENIDQLRLECLTQACVYFEGLCEYYGSGFNEMADKYREQYKELCASYVENKE